jgi:uncharacterized membrane protein (UPF0127 family)
MSLVKSLGATLLAVAFAAFLLVSLASAQALEPLTIVTGSGEHVFQVEIARTEAEHAKGLMFRRYMPADRGMLFEFQSNDPVAFWMKNTYIGLDMVFIAPNGSVTRVVENAEPLSEALIPSGGPAKAVLELNAGAAAKIGLKVGDSVRAAFFKP